MRINGRNGMEVAKWLLQCDAEDFHGPLERVEEWFDSLWEVYSHYCHPAFTTSAEVCAEKKQATVLAQRLFEHLHKKAKHQLQERLTKNN